ncbi:general secretion pathway protein GspG [Rhodanobacter thiooxydans]|uniref:General secretion pathway protein GspG n=1 Tax=Rhodanobacter thiooxydans TaxID=416169 RepID=A0A154QFL8_9GAMM|nr:type II secretion system protein [Rhodanobacter thiooxydans]EIL98057.1 type II secretion system transmembrane protein [Rhodanobacter thiooxydans LCS2]KZC23072.1 general secretion pathway protein GspG [Rhodanobacter thiooxydans]MCW0203585.1 type II secretion system GspH family protein [Rhodanobacter thiooxydans]
MSGLYLVGRRRSHGFSFIELLATLAIMAVLLLVAVPSARLVTQRHREAELRSALATIRDGIDHYRKAVEQGRIQAKLGQSGYPPDLAVLTEGVDDVSTPDRRKIYFLRRLPADPMYVGAAVDPAATWGLRSYASPPDAPAAGDDVFDVYSTSAGTGLNDVPYKDW